MPNSQGNPSAHGDQRKIRTVAVVGGGLAGLAAASALAQHGIQVSLFEARRVLGGRAGSFRDSASGLLIDHCQHVALGCCTNFADFCRRTRIWSHFRRDKKIQFFAAGHAPSSLAPAWLPAPLHLLPSLFGMRFLALHERLGIARAVVQMARLRSRDFTQAITAGEWLRQQHQSNRAIDLFWNTILVSALGESLDKASLAAARKVIVDGFLAHHEASDLLVPTMPLGELFDKFVGAWLNQYQVSVYCEAPVRSVSGDKSGANCLQLASGQEVRADAYVLAVPWRRLHALLDDSLRQSIPSVANLSGLGASPISSIHLWFDRPFTRLPHAVLVGSTAQWLFSHPMAGTGSSTADNALAHYQVVISASRNLANRSREEITAEVLADLARHWPESKNRTLQRSIVVTDPEAVFSLTPQAESLRPFQATPVSNVFLAGDWTSTGWPATMEGAVRSGYFAAEAVLKAAGNVTKIVQPDLKRNTLTRLLCGIV